MYVPKFKVGDKLSGNGLSERQVMTVLGVGKDKYFISLQYDIENSKNFTEYVREITDVDSLYTLYKPNPKVGEVWQDLYGQPRKLIALYEGYSWWHRSGGSPIIIDIKSVMATWTKLT